MSLNLNHRQFFVLVLLKFKYVFLQQLHKQKSQLMLNWFIKCIKLEIHIFKIVRLHLVSLYLAT